MQCHPNFCARICIQPHSLCSQEKCELRPSGWFGWQGENMAWGSTTDYFTSNGRDFKYVANMWYNEVEYYDFAQPG